MKTPPAAIADSLARDGFSVVELDDDDLRRVVQPWRLVLGLVGVAPSLVEVQPIEPVVGGRSFAASTGEAPLHTDSQLWLGRPPDLQVNLCLRPATRGGACTLVDGLALATELQAREPGLLDAMLRRPRCMPFVFGSVYGPTLARRAGRYVFTHPARPLADDEVGRRVAAAVDRAPRVRVGLVRMQALLVDNHRMLHGRDAFEDANRSLVRVLAWLDQPLGPRPWWADAADGVADRLAASLADATDDARRAFGVPCPEPSSLDLAVLAIASGAPPGAIARRLGVSEQTLYRHRNRLGAAPPTAAAGAAADPDDECNARLEALLGVGDR